MQLFQNIADIAAHVAEQAKAGIVIEAQKIVRTAEGHLVFWAREKFQEWAKDMVAIGGVYVAAPAAAAVKPPTAKKKKVTAKK